MEPITRDQAVVINTRNRTGHLRTVLVLASLLAAGLLGNKARVEVQESARSVCEAQGDTPVVDAICQNILGIE